MRVSHAHTNTYERAHREKKCVGSDQQTNATLWGPERNKRESQKLAQVDQYEMNHPRSR